VATVKPGDFNYEEMGKKEELILEEIKKIAMPCKVYP